MKTVIGILLLSGVAMLMWLGWRHGLRVDERVAVRYWLRRCWWWVLVPVFLFFVVAVNSMFSMRIF